MSEDKLREDFENLERWARALALHYDDETVFKILLCIGTRRLFASKYTASGVAGAFRLFAEQIERANPAAWSIENVVKLADQGMRAASGRQQGTVKRVTDGAMKRARVRAHFEELAKSSSTVAAIAATAKKFGLSERRVRQITKGK